MKICDLFSRGKVVVSFEIFPPKPSYPLDSVFATLDGLRELAPDFISVTYGAGGSNAGRSIEIADKVKNSYQIETVAHLTCVGAAQADIDAVLRDLKRRNIENILALRGDPPAGETGFTQTPGGFCFARDLISHIKQRDLFCIAAAAYPEGHIDCRDLNKDLEYLKLKVAAGVDFLVTQLFFDNTMFYRFRDKLRQAGIACPVMVGIMPVLSASQVQRITSLGGASIPERLARLMEKYGAKPADMEKAGIEYASEQIVDLLQNQVDGVHLYTMNKKEQAKVIMRQTGLRKA